MEDYGYDFLIDKSVDRAMYIRDCKKMIMFSHFIKFLNFLKLALSFLLGMVLAILI